MQAPPPPRFNLQRPPVQPATPSHPNTPRGQLHVKLLQARHLHVSNPLARPYVVVQFEQNEFVSREPTDETEKEVKGVPVSLSRNTSSTALSALGAIGLASRGGSAKSSLSNSPASSTSSGKSSLRDPRTVVSNTSAASVAPSTSLFGSGRSAHNPVWKHQVSFDVTSDQSVITFNIYDRADENAGFLGMLELKPVLIHDHTVDQWHKLQPHKGEKVTGEIRVQITYEQYKTKRTLTPRDFEFLKLIGRGTFGRVFQVRKKDTKRIYAMKVLSKKEIVAKKEVAHTIGERKILQRSLESPFLVGLKFSFQTDKDLYLVTDFKSGGELFWHLQKETRFAEDRARFYIAELILALEHLHKYDIVYRDLKPENILLDATGHVALCDFGLSKPDLPSDQLTNTFCGTTEYLAPEVLLDDHGYSKLVDFWSLGVLLFEMCCGWSPFYAEDTQQMYKNICFGKIRFPKGVINEDGKQFVKGLLNRNPKHRLGAQRDAAELKEHPFFKTIDWRALSLKQVTPPFKPEVESDESTANFDPEFTSANMEDFGLIDDDLDDDDPSEAWVESASLSNSGIHMPNGPLGSDNKDKGLSNGTGISIKSKKKKAQEEAASVLTSSVQDKFKGFSYTGESLANPSYFPVHPADEHSGQATPEANSEDEFDDDSRIGGRYAGRRRDRIDMDME
ncbi:Pkinase-domain-containing protein [Sistotremastrum suecicum HHB10207 ss-3]|uniref:Pkinase-domain-containing protein n=1 Tax=Sistotremastrum suecicum HHB10207 ss-3 TaxID=1314776 RepID=A0A166HN62_9AGAM|nr:Pkinase-domain-containing protein [Sistotremastrum suecicum HHB10207 ss-3]